MTVRQLRPGEPPDASDWWNEDFQEEAGFWLFQKRFSKGRLQWWPRHTTDGVAALPAEQLAVLIYNGLPLRAGMAEAWRRVS